MFRQMRRFKQQITDKECREILKNEKRGVLAVLGDEDYPYTVPIDYFYDEEDGSIYFHGAKEGHKVDAIKKHDKVSFCVYDEGFRRDGEWALNITSVVVFGRMHIVEDYDRTVEISRKLALKYYPDAESAEKEVQNAKDRVMSFRLTPEHMTGKIVNES